MPKLLTVVIGLILPLVAKAAGAAVTADGPPRPNIVVILADDK